MKNNKSENEKPKGWANLQQQLKEVREESFKQGVWKGREEKLLKAKDNFIKIIESKDLLERLSDLEHQQWENWSKNIVNNEKISEDRLDKWAGLWKPYNKLTEEQKEKDREYARLVLEELKQKISKEIKDEKNN